ncbi:MULTISPECIES: hypothetical protein [Microbacterium]|uniref:hypothetical protein n=1 Tax=Microbacterium TaxID=33882 RepID=UPI00300FA7D1
MDADRGTGFEEDAADHGGDAACWLAQVCPECGALLDDRVSPCWRCGRSPGASDA